MKAKNSFLVIDVLRTAGQAARSIALRRFPLSEVTRQLYEFGVSSLGIVSLCVGFVGVIMMLEYSYHMKLVIGNDTLIPSFAMIMLARELAPAISALLLTSKMGASIAAELGAMKTSEQLDAYRLLGLSAIDLFVAPKVVASALALVCLAVVALFVSVVGGWLAAITMLNFTTGSFFQALFVFTRSQDLVLCVLKAFVFGASIPVISATFGFKCKFGAEGVGLATKDAVVANSIWIIILDFILTYVFSLFN